MSLLLEIPNIKNFRKKYLQTNWPLAIMTYHKNYMWDALECNVSIEDLTMKVAHAQLYYFSTGLLS